MKRLFTVLAKLITCAIMFSGCATIVGGSNYYAHVTVDNNPNARIMYMGGLKGTGHATIKVKRKEAHLFSVTVMEEGCEPQTFNYQSRTFRGWAFAGTILGWTGAINGFPVPWGVIVDLMTGAVYKPNVKENGISKADYKNFNYNVKYTNCSVPATDTYTSTMIDVLILKNGTTVKGIITELSPGIEVKIRQNDGKIIVYKMKEIERITLEEAERF